MAIDRNQLRVKRAPAIISREVADEFVVIDTATDTAHALSGDVARVWASTEGRSVADLGPDRTQLALDTLVALNLVEMPAGLTRRAALKRGGVLVGSFGVVGVASMALPEAAQAASLIPSIFNVSPALVAGASQSLILTVYGGNLQSTDSVFFTSTGRLFGNGTAPAITAGPVTITNPNPNSGSLTTTITIGSSSATVASGFSYSVTVKNGAGAGTGSAFFELTV